MGWFDWMGLVENRFVLIPLVEVLKSKVSVTCWEEEKTGRESGKDKKTAVEEAHRSRREENKGWSHLSSVQRVHPFTNPCV